MATLEAFLRTGELGSLKVGVTTTHEIFDELGEPESVSKKSNPAIFKYGCLQLTLWKGPTEKAQRLTEILISYYPTPKPMPSRLQLSDWNVADVVDSKMFKSYLDRIAFGPTAAGLAARGEEILFASGVVALFMMGVLHSIRLTKREIKNQPSVRLSSEGQATKREIVDMLTEADRAFDSGARRAALLIAWAGAEAALRRTALSKGLEGKVGVQPALLVREVHAANGLTHQEMQVLESARQLRMNYAHGIAESGIDRSILESLKGVTQRMLAALPESI